MNDQYQALLKWQETWVSVNSSFLGRYFDTTNTALQNITEKPEEYEEFQEHGLEPQYVQSVISNHISHHRGVLLAYANFDEFFTKISKALGAHVDCPVDLGDLKDRGFKRFKKYIHKACKVPTDEVQIDWDFLADFSEVRNSIIHANGNRIYLNSADKLDSIVNKYPDLLSYSSGVKLVVDNNYVFRCIAEVRIGATSLLGYMAENT